MTITCCGKTTKRTLTLNNIIRADPTRTLTVRKRFVADMNKRFNRLKLDIIEAIIKNDVFGLNDPVQFLQSRSRQFAFPRSVDKLAGFMSWLQRQINLGILEQSAIPGARVIGAERAWTDKYIRSAYQRGIVRGRGELVKAGAGVPTLEQTGGIVSAFNQPFHVDRVGLIYTRTFEELENITREMSNQISRVLAEGLTEGRSPREIARTINNRVDKIGRTRSRILARTEVIRAHHAANMQEYRQAGIEGVEVLAEWSTAGFGVCPLCFPLEGKKFKLDQIENLLPRHPQCRCVALPLVDKEARAARSETITRAEGEKLGDDNIKKGKDAEQS